jgi:hypothetical protein
LKSSSPHHPPITRDAVVGSYPEIQHITLHLRGTEILKNWKPDCPPGDPGFQDFRISEFQVFALPLQPFHLTPAKLPKHIEEYGKLVRFRASRLNPSRETEKLET